MRNIYVITHAQSQHHIDKVVGGWFDTSLTEIGRAQAAAVATRLNKMLEGKKVFLISSDLKRAAETAAIIGHEIGAEVSLDSGFRENSYGVAEGKPQSWLDARIIIAPPRNRLDHLVIAGAESKREFVNRIYTSMSKLPKDSDAIIVTHGYALTFAIAYWIGLPLEDAGYVNFPATAGSISHLQEGGFFENKVVKFFNDSSHLSQL